MTHKAILSKRVLVYTSLAWGLLYLLVSCGATTPEDPAVLVFSKTEGWYHESIPQGNAALLELGYKNGIKVDTTSKASAFTEDNLQQYSAVIFLNTTGDILDEAQQLAFEGFIKAGGGFVGIHGAADTEHQWPWYGSLVGAYFEDHPEVQEAVLHVQDQEHPATQMLPKEWTRTDEWYTFKDFDEDIKVLITIDEDTYEGGGNGEWHPVSWYKPYEGGRAFYTALGHGEESYRESLFLEHLLGGISYAIYGNDKLLEKSSE